MADFNTRYKLYPYLYTPVIPRKGNVTWRDTYRERAPVTLQSCKGGRIPLHDCREPIIKDIHDTHKWDCYILSHGLQATVESVNKSHHKPKASFEERKPDKLLFHLGNGLNAFGSDDAEFFWPRDLAVKSSGMIVVADTMNHRIQILNGFGVLVKKFGKFGAAHGEFNEPTGVAITPNDEVIVADSKNKRIQIFTRKSTFKESFYTNDEPYSIALDMYKNVIVSTTKRTIEMYRKTGKLVNRFAVPSDHPTEDICYLYVAIDDMNQHIVVSDPADRAIKKFNYSGEELSRFQPQGFADGLACSPAGIVVLLSGNIVACDTLNHAVVEYDERGVLVKQLIGATDMAGTIQQCALGPEGHLIVTEYSSIGNHCIKIFRYKDCECHRFRPGSSKRPKTPNAFELRTTSNLD